MPVILIYPLTGPWLMEHDLETIFKEIEKCREDPVVLDFQMVSEVSKRFAVNYARKLKGLNRRVIEVNMSAEVAKHIAMGKGLTR